MSTVLGWWFSKEEMLHVDGEIIPCQHGLHLSETVLDALCYASGNVLWRVEGSGTMVAQGNPADQYACSDGRALWKIDSEPVLLRFARRCALDMIHLWDAPALAREYLVTGHTGQKKNWDAADAARYAADVARDAAGAAAGAARAAHYAAWHAAWDAAWDAAWAARYAAWAARDAAGAAAGAAAWDAAWAAAWERQNQQLTEMVIAAHEGTLDLSAPLEVPDASR